LPQAQTGTLWSNEERGEKALRGLWSAKLQCQHQWLCNGSRMAAATPIVAPTAWVCHLRPPHRGVALPHRAALIQNLGQELSVGASPQIGWGHQPMASEWSQLLIEQKCLCGEAIIVQSQRQNLGPTTVLFSLTV